MRAYSVRSFLLYFTLLWAGLGFGASVAQAQSCLMFVNRVGVIYTDILAAAQSELPTQPYCYGGGCDTSFTIDPSTCVQGASWSCTIDWVLVDAPGSTYCEANPGSCGPQVGWTNDTSGVVDAGACQGYWLTAVKPGENCSKNCVGDPINPGPGNVYKREEDDIRVSGASPLAFQRFYDSSDKTGSNLGPGWRHTYNRSIVISSQVSTSTAYPGVSTLVSNRYSTPAAACVSGFADIQSAVSAWAGANATYTDNACVISNGGNTIGTLAVQSLYLGDPLTTVVEYDVIRDDGKTYRYTTQGGSINAPPGVSLRLAVTASGYTLTDDQDNVEAYDKTGLLQSITSRSGVVQTLTYYSGGTGALYSVADSFGNSLVLGNGFGSFGGPLNNISINSGTPVQFGFGSSSLLTSVTQADSTQHKYVYGNSNFVNALTSEIDENNSTYATWTYDTQERGTGSSLAGGANAVSLAYNYPNSTTVTNALGAVTTLSFTSSGDQMPVTSITGSPCMTCDDSAATTYDSAGWVASRTDYNGNLACYTNDPVRGLELVRVEGFAPGSTCPGNLAAYVPAAGTAQRKIATTWSTAFRLPSQIVEATRTTSFNYDGSGNLLTRTVTDTTATPNVSRTWTYTYNNFGQVLTAQGPRTDLNSTRTFTYYNCASGGQCGQVQTVTDELGHVTTFNTYNAYGQPLTVTDPNGVVTTLTYDARRRLSSRSAAGETTSLSYYPTGLLKTVTLPDSSNLTYTYDAAHRLTQITDGLGNQIVHTLDAMGNHVADSVYDPSNALTLARTQVFNVLSELYRQIGSAGTAAVTSTFGYDSNGNQTSVSAPMSRNAAGQYDALNRLIQITDPANGVTTLGYDANDNLSSVVDPKGLNTGYTYDGFGDLVQQSSPDTGVTTRAYDSGGNLARSTDARGQTGTYSYDARNRLTQVAYGDQTITFGYDTGTNGVGHLTSAGDANHALAWSYDALGRVVGKSQTVGSGTSAITKSVGYTYTNADLTSLLTPSGQTVTYGYTNGRITSISVNGKALLSEVLYQPFGSVAGWTWANGTNEARVYDQDGNVTNLEAAEGFTYGYDNAFRITGITDTDNAGLSQSYAYDLLDRLTSATGSGVNESWTYDANGNRLTQGGATSSTYTVASTSNQITGITGALTRTYAYAPSGQTTGYGGLAFTYMDSGRLSAVTNGGATTTYVLNALGQRVKKSGTSVTFFVYDESGHLLGEYDGSGNLIEETVWMGDVPVATLQPNGTGISVYYIHTDHLNAPRRVSRPADNVIVWRWDSEPFGTAAANEDPDGDGTLFVYNLRFPGQYYDAETGLNYNYFRDYDPTTGRYIESDPIGVFGGPSTYAYAAGNPISYRDPLGLVTTVVINNNTPFTGTHAGLYVTNGVDGRTIYDPSGSYQQETRGEDGVFSQLPPGGFLDYFDYQWRDGPDVQTLIFNTTPAQERDISQRAEDHGDPRGLKCADSVARVLNDVGPFKGLGKILDLDNRILAVSPSELLDALRTLQQQAEKHQ